MGARCCHGRLIIAVRGAESRGWRNECDSRTKKQPRGWRELELETCGREYGTVLTVSLLPGRMKGVETREQSGAPNGELEALAASCLAHDMIQ